MFRLRRFIGLVVYCVLLGLAPAVASSTAASDEAIWNQARAEWTSKATQEAMFRNADGKLYALKKEIEALDARIASTERQLIGSRDALAQTRVQRDELAKKQQAVVAELARRDESYRIAIGAFRAALEGLAENPEKKQYLDKFYRGDIDGAFAGLERIAASQKLASDIALAKTYRENAELAFAAIGRGKVTTQSVVTKIVNAAALDPRFRDYARLAELYRMLGRVENEKTAVAAMVRLSQTDREKFLAKSYSAKLQARHDNASGATELYEELIKIDGTFADVVPYAITTDYIELLLRNGAVKRGAELVEQTYPKAIANAEQRPTPDNWNIVTRIVDAKISLLRAQNRDVEAALKVVLHVRQQIFAKTAGADDEFNVSVSYRDIGVDAIEKQQYNQALSNLQSSLNILNKIYQKDPENFRIARLIPDVLFYISSANWYAGNAAAAVSTQDEQIAQARRLYQRWPDEPDAADALAGALHDRIRRRIAMREGLEYADLDLLESLNLYAGFERNRPGEPGWSFGCGKVLSTLGRVYSQTNRNDRAVAAYESALSRFKALSKAAPGNKDYQIAAAMAFLGMSFAHESAGDMAAATRSHESGVGILENLKSQDLLNAFELDLLDNLVPPGTKPAVQSMR